MNSSTPPKRFKQGQIFSIDLLISGAILIIILVSVIFFWNYSQRKMTLQEQRFDLYALGEKALSQLLLTPGQPYNWESFSSNQDFLDKVQALGLAPEPLVISSEKLNRFTALDYNQSKILLGLIGPGYEYSLSIYSWNGTSFNPESHFGQLQGEIPEISKISRLALLDEQIVKVELYLGVQS